MFNKKKEIPLLTYFTLKVNLSALDKWVAEPSKIYGTPDREWKDAVVKEYQITLLPNESFTFYHNQANEFSPSIGGLDILDNENIGCIEWSWNQSYFYVNVSHPRITVFSVPIDEIFHLLKTGEIYQKRHWEMKRLFRSNRLKCLMKYIGREQPVLL